MLLLSWNTLKVCGAVQTHGASHHPKRLLLLRLLMSHRTIHPMSRAIHPSPGACGPLRLLPLRRMMSHPTSQPRGHTIHSSRGACGRGRLLPQFLHDIEGQLSNMQTAHRLRPKS